MTHETENRANAIWKLWTTGKFSTVRKLAKAMSVPEYEAWVVCSPMCYIMDVRHERWIKGWEGEYSVTDDGRIRSHKNGKVKDMSLSQQRYNHDCPHFMVLLSRRNESKKKYVHRAVLEAFVGEAPAGCECCHNDGNTANNRLENLRWDTHSSNSKDALAHGTHFGLKNKGKVGELSPCASISDEQAEALVKAWNEGSYSTYSEFARAVGISYQMARILLSAGSCSWVHIREKVGVVRQSVHKRMKKEQAMEVLKAWNSGQYETYANLDRALGLDSGLAASICSPNSDKWKSLREVASVVTEDSLYI